MKNENLCGPGLQRFFIYSYTGIREYFKVVPNRIVYNRPKRKEMLLMKNHC
jgi:hypothetical protein